MVISSLAGNRIRRQLPHFTEVDAAGLAGAVETLLSTFQPSKIFVFGSQARGTATPDSDIDLLIVVPETAEPPYRLSQRAYVALGPHRLPIEIVFMTTGEFEWRSRAAASLPATVLREGCLLFAA